VTARGAWPITLVIGLTAVLASCFDSLITDSCTAGFARRNGTCVAVLGDAGAPTGAAPDGGPGTPLDAAVDAAPEVSVDAAPDRAGDAALDAGLDAGPGVLADAAIDAAPAVPADAAVDAAPDAPACLAPRLTCGGACVDTTTDADNCGSCGRVCASGVCAAGACTGSLRGHIVAIGHDYRSFHPAMARVLGDAVSLGAAFNVRVARWAGTAVPASQAGVTQAITAAMLRIGRPWTAATSPVVASPSALVGIDVLLVDAQTGDGLAAEVAGAAWKPVLASFLQRGGVVIVLESTGGVSYRFAAGAALYYIAAPVDATGQLAMVVDGADITTQQVVSPYLAETSSATLPGAPAPSIATAAGGALVFHITR